MQVEQGEWILNEQEMAAVAAGFGVHARRLGSLPDKLPAGPEAEAAFSVEPAWQNRGIGNELMGRVVRSARNRGVRHLLMSCLAENRKIQAIARKHHAELTFELGDVIGTIAPDQATYLSQLEESLGDEFDFMIAVLDISKSYSDVA